MKGTSKHSNRKAFIYMMVDVKVRGFWKKREIRIPKSQLIVVMQKAIYSKQ